MTSALRPPIALRLPIALLVLPVVLFAAGCAGDAPPPAGPDVRPDDPEHLHAAVAALTDVMVYDIFSPPQASRIYAYAGVAAYEALVPFDVGYRSLAGQLRDLPPVPRPGDGEYAPTLAAAHALLTVGEAFVFSEEDLAAHREALHGRFERAVAPDVLARSAAYGEAVARHVLAWAAADGYAASRSAPKFTVVAEPGRWQPTPPGYLDGVEPNWHTLRPFTLARADQFAPPPPPPFSVEPGTAFRAEVDAVHDAVRGLTDEQRAIAAFWDCNPYVMHTRGHAMFATKKITPGGHWIGITAIAARLAGSDTPAAAEAYARVGVALADAFLSAWDEKYRSALVRPETVINGHLDEAWAPVLQTPPFPEYPSGHSVISAAAAVVLTDLYGPDVAFDDTTEVAYGLPVRSFPSFEAAAEEAAVSRLYGGIHYPMAIAHGLMQGRAVGAHVLARVHTREQAVAGR